MKDEKLQRDYSDYCPVQRGLLLREMLKLYIGIQGARFRIANKVDDKDIASLRDLPVDGDGVESDVEVV
jgi:hypothetical protein